MSKFDDYSKLANINSMNHKWNTEKILPRHIMIKLLKIVISKNLKSRGGLGETQYREKRNKEESRLLVRARRQWSTERKPHQSR